jgi:SAM-dependent methyltransferase
MKAPYEEEMWKRYREEIEKRIAYYREVISLIPLDVEGILDVGCGEGTFLKMLTSFGRASMIVGLDVSETALKYVEGERVHASAGGLPFENGSFDLVTCLETLEHLKQEVFIRAIEEIRGVAKRYIIVSVPNEEPLEYFLVVCPACGCHFNAVGHVRSFSLEIIRELFFPDFSLKTLRECGDFVEYPTYNRVLFGALRSYLKPQPPRGSICPQCGYVAKADEGRISYSQMPTSLKAVKRIADLLWRPKRRRRWLVGLYERVKIR